MNENDLSLPKEKLALREWAKTRRASLDMAAVAARLAVRLAALPEFARARNVLIYLALPGEVNVEELCAQNGDGRRFYVPRCAPRRRLAVYRFMPGETPLVSVPPFGIREPDPAAHVPETDPAVLDLLIVPALLLSERGDRLGYGGGYYDRFLPRRAPGCACVGALPDALVLPWLPRDSWDQKMDVIATETHILRPGGGPAT